jgi:methionyl-tRNA formyltransferase
MSLRIVFAGTPDFAVPSLAALLDAGHTLAAVYTQPDRPAGRGRGLKPSAVKRFAVEHGLQVRQPATLKGEADALRALAPQLMVVVAYGQILRPEVLALPTHGCINVHASLLPRWRGAAPIQRAIEAGDTLTGVTIMRMDRGLDTGDILHQASTPITADDTAQSLHDRLAQLGAQALVDTLRQLEEGRLARRPQDETLATYAAKLSKDETEIDWSQPATAIARRIAAFNPWPVACTHLDGKVLRLWRAGVVDVEDHGEPGSIVRADAGGIIVQTGRGTLRIDELQASGGRVLEVGAFLNGHVLRPGDSLGR